MKTKLAILLCLFLMMTPSFAGHPDEEAVILPGGVTAFDDFNTDTINSDRWQSNYITDFKGENDGLLIKSNGYSKYLYIPYDFNAGALKSNYYRFVMDFYEKKNWYKTAGFTIKQDLDKVYESLSETSTYFTNNKYTTKINGNTYSNNIIRTSSLDTMTYEIILQRVGNSNDFDVTVKEYKNDLLKFTRTGQASYDKIYPTLMGRQRANGKITRFEAYRVPMQNDSVTITSLVQSGNQLGMRFSLDADFYEKVEIVFSEDDTVSFDGSDTELYKGASDTSHLDVAITETMKNNGKIGVRGQNNGVYSSVAIVDFNYLKEVNDFGYALTDVEDSYKYTWTEVQNADGYEISYDTFTIDKSSDDRTLTLYGIADPGSVSIVAIGNGTVGASASRSISTNATKSALGKVLNLIQKIDLDNVQLSWDAYPAADGYIVFQETSIGSFVTLEDNMTVTNHLTTLNNDFVVNRYKVKAVVGGQWSEASDILDVKNHVKAIQSTLDTASQTINLSWTPIADATSYKVYVSNNSGMSSPTVETVSTNTYDFTYALNDVANKYVQVEAINVGEVSDKNDPVTIDMSANVTAENFVASYTPNSHIVNLSWDAIPNAVDYKIYVGKSDGETSYVATTDDESYNYSIVGSDADILYFKLQGIGASQTYVISPAVHTMTYSLDVVKNLSATKIGDTIQLSWASLFRSDAYILEISDDIDMTSAIVVNQSDVSYDYTILESDGLTKYFRVRALYGGSESEYSSVTNSDASEAIIMTIDSRRLSHKIYGAPMVFPIEIEVNERVIYNASLELKLENALHPNGTTVMKYIYPEIESIHVVDSRVLDFVPIELTYVTKITTGLVVGGVFRANAGYVATAIITDGALNTYIGLGYDLVVDVKTDLVFEQGSTINNQSILYVGPTEEPLTWMELPFVLEEQIKQVELAISSAEGSLVTPIQDKDFFSVKFNYDRTTNGDNNSVESIVNIIFKNKNLVPTY